MTERGGGDGPCWNVDVTETQNGSVRVINESLSSRTVRTLSLTDFPRFFDPK